MTTVPLFWAFPAANRGLRISIPAFIARAAMSTSGTKTSLFLNFTPITFIPSSSPWSRISSAPIPSSTACCTSSLTSLAFPFCRNSESAFMSAISFPPCMDVLSIAWSTKHVHDNQGFLTRVSPSPAPSRFPSGFVQVRPRLQWRARGGITPHFPCNRRIKFYVIYGNPRHSIIL